MKWEDHRRIIREVCRALNVPQEITSSLSKAIITPDEQPDYYYYYRRGRRRKRRVPHHSEIAIRVAWEYIKEARKKHLKGQDPSYELGRALHYIHDYTVNPSKKLWIFSVKDWKKHEEIEQSIKDHEISQNIIFEGANLRKPNEFKDRLFLAKKHREPEKALDEAVFLTASTISVVFNPEREGRNFAKALAIHLILLISPLLILGVVNPNLLFFGFIVSYILHKLDIPFHKANLERMWFKKYA